VSDDVLFDDTGLQVTPDATERTAGERLRFRQAARITAGMHPLSLQRPIPLHPDAPRDAAKDDGGTYPRCGTCRFRWTVGGGAQSYPKCTFGRVSRYLTADRLLVTPGPRESHGPATDVRAWWPACIDYSPAEAS
jgi:hypothetical protein